MKSDRSWIQHFQIEESQIPKQGENGHYGTALYRCLKKGLIKSNDYLNWARNHFEISVLRESFFSKEIDADLWYEVENFHTWSNEMVPVAKWRDIIYVACIQPSQVPENQNFVYLLAGYGFLESRFKAYKKLSPESQNPGTEENLPDGFFNNEETITKTSPNFPETPDDDLVTFKDHETQVGKKVHEHTFVGVQLGKSSALGTIAHRYLPKLKPLFDNALLLEPQGSELVASAWDPSWQPRNPPTECPLPLEEPSIFKIVARSMKPYHGYVVSSPVNDGFFSNWTGKLPEHTTVVPILAMNRIVGMLLAVGKKDIPQRSSLQLAEKISKKIAEKYTASKAS